MTSLLLIISFLLHIVLFITIFQLYQQIQQLKQSKHSELHTMLDEFVSEIKQENQRLQERITYQANQDKSNELQLTNKSEQTIEQPLSKSPLPFSKKHFETESLNHNIEDLTEAKHEEMEVSIESKILQLKHQGFNIDQIAEQLQCGRTEVELVVHLQQQLKHNT